VPLHDGWHIIYINGMYNGNDNISTLMYDFHAKFSKNIHYKVLADSIHHFKKMRKDMLL
jgi:hypothetical protein